MTNPDLPAINALKSQAKRLRAALADDGDFISHSEALELIAKQNGFRDWNTLYAAKGNRPEPLKHEIGGRISGRYLGQPFVGEIIGIELLSNGRRRVTVDFDEPVDVVSFDSFSAFRKRVSCVISEYGVSPEHTSNGNPLMQIARN